MATLKHLTNRLHKSNGFIDYVAPTRNNAQPLFGCSFDLDLAALGLGQTIGTNG